VRIHFMWNRERNLRIHPLALASVKEAPA